MNADQILRMYEELGDNGLYVKVVPTAESVKALQSLLDEYVPGINVPDNAHVTILYSKSVLDSNLPHQLANTEDPNIVRSNVIDNVGTTIGHKGQTVLRVEFATHGYLSQLNRKWIAAGYKGTFDEYLPHMTLDPDYTVNPDLKASFKLLNLHIRREAPSMNFSQETCDDLR